MRTLSIIALLCALALAGVGCGDDDDDNGGSSGNVNTTETKSGDDGGGGASDTGGGGKAQTLKLSADPGGALKFDKTTKVTAAVKAGEYEYYCPVDGHKAAGMEGTLTVQ
jgi:uncharacterized cupredoxin-like copper-binding protein